MQVKVFGATGVAVEDSKLERRSDEECSKHVNKHSLNDWVVTINCWTVLVFYRSISMVKIVYFTIGSFDYIASRGVIHFNNTGTHE